MMNALNVVFPQRTPGKVQNPAFEDVKYTGLFTIERNYEKVLSSRKTPEHLKLPRKRK